MASKRYTNIARRLFDQPHMVTASALRAVILGLKSRFGLEEDEIEPIAPGLIVHVEHDEEHRLLSRTVSGVAVIDCFGELVHRKGDMDALSGLTSYGEIEDALDAAMEDQAVGSIVLNIDSPGGEVAGVFELADRIRAATASKPIVAYAHELAASAAYLLASACSAIYTTQAGTLGSVGVVMAHLDQSGADAKSGYKVTHLYAGAHKVDGSPHSPLTDDARAELQAHVDQLYAIFAGKVAEFRGLALEQIVSTEARVFIGSKAVEAGLADGIVSADALLAGMTRGGAIAASLQGGPMARKAKLEASTRPAAEDTAAAFPPPDEGQDEDEEEDEPEDNADAVAAKFPKSAAALRAEGATQERARIAALEGLALPGHEALLKKAISEGMTEAQFALEQTKAEKSNPGRRFIEDRREETRAATISAATPPPARPSGNPEVRAEQEWERDPKLQDEFPTKASYVAYAKANAQGLVRIHSPRRG